MRQRTTHPTSSLPSLMMPCSMCAGRMVFHDRHAVGPELEDMVYACQRCGAEVVRTTVHAGSGPGRRGAAAAA